LNDRQKDILKSEQIQRGFRHIMKTLLLQFINYLFIYLFIYSYILLFSIVLRRTPLLNYFSFSFFYLSGECCELLISDYK